MYFIVITEGLMPLRIPGLDFTAGGVLCFCYRSLASPLLKIHGFFYRKSGLTKPSGYIK